ncbi:MAG: pyridoxal 5'-phosphate synthase glutaminase subunit PdxT [Dysgonamonadaceae bacterium]|jgi:5'-phosphate synthase pdxT subunit|nr:pyridoxal 5'-phosphate synthase glutaminase subunit PdxT [Dysgonamonadaceae bacterium]
MRVGVLALQGGFIEHIRHLQSLGADTFEIRKCWDLAQPMDGLIIPGGESTTIGKLLNDLDLFDDLKKKIDSGLPVFGTCAGMILLAREIAGTETVYFDSIDIIVKRNAYGRQLGSFFTEAEMTGIGTVPMTFIRAPYIESAGAGVEILSVVNGRIVAAREKNVLVTAFHPELTSDNRVHRYFIENVIRI